VKKNDELIKEFSGVNEKVQHLSIEQIKDIVHGPWRFLKKEMQNGELSSVRFKYFGIFKVHYGRARRLFFQLGVSLDKGLITFKDCIRFKKMIGKFLSKKIMNKDVLVILDYGHGGINPVTGEYVTPGKRSPIWSDGKQYFEGEGNRKIGKYIEEDLKFLDIPYLKLANSWKDTPLKERVKMANRCTGRCFGISIHSNAGGGTSAEVWTSPGDTPADPMATISLEEFKKTFPDYADEVRTDYRDGDPDKESRFTILTETTMPFFLPEAFFMDQEKECKEILMTDEGLRRIAKWHVSTIVRIINERF